MSRNFFEVIIGCSSSKVRYYLGFLSWMPSSLEHVGKQMQIKTNDTVLKHSLFCKAPGSIRDEASLFELEI